VLAGGERERMSTKTEPVDLVEIPIAKWRPAYDDETGMASLPALLEHLQRALVRLSRQSLTLGLLVTEIPELEDDDTPEIDRAELLHQITARLASAIRAGDIPGRIAPATFALLCEDLGSLDEAIQIAQRVLNALDEPFELGDRTLVLRPSLGLGFPVGEDRPDQLMRRSLEALHAARLNPRTRYDVILGSPDTPRPLFE
jgi:GGDEF domain-containing protein